MAESSTITRDHFPNYAGVKNIDDALAAELEAAGITVHRFGFLKNGKSEVDTEVVGELHGWSFRRAWYYWRAEGPGIEVAAAEKLHATHGGNVRVAGHCGCPSPTEWFKGLAVGSYHVDRPSGLKALAETIQGLVQRAGAAPDLRADRETLRKALSEITDAADKLILSLPGHWHDDATIELTDAASDARAALSAAAQNDLYDVTTEAARG